MWNEWAWRWRAVFWAFTFAAVHLLEPHFNWRNLYVAEEDERSPFYGRTYSELYFTHAVYDHFIHPQWDSMGSTTLFIKLLYVDYDERFAVIELIGEWNDTLYNDVMTLKRNIIDLLVDEGIEKFILAGDNVMNFHPSDDSYYEEWFEDVPDGWIALLNLRPHIVSDFKSAGISSYAYFGGEFNELIWTSYRPAQLFQKIDQMINGKLALG